MTPKVINVQRKADILINMFTYNTAFATKIWILSKC